MTNRTEFGFQPMFVGNRITALGWEPLWLEYVNYDIRVCYILPDGPWEDMAEWEV